MNRLQQEQSTTEQQIILEYEKKIKNWQQKYTDLYEQQKQKEQSWYTKYQQSQTLYEETMQQNKGMYSQF